MMTTTAYRDPLERARLRLSQLFEERGVFEVRGATHRRVLVRRAARVAFGAVGTAGMLVVALAAALNALSSAWPRPWPLTRIMLFTWAAAAAAWALVRLAGWSIPVRRAPEPTGRPLADLERFEAFLARRLDGRTLAVWSAALPAVAISLLTPLTLHLGYLWLFARHDSDDLRQFDDWIGMSCAIVGHAHLVLAGLAAAYGRRMASAPLEAVDRDRERGFKALGWTVLASAVPGVVLIGIPPALVAITGIAFIPFLWMATRAVALAERRELANAGFARC